MSAYGASQRAGLPFFALGQNGSSGTRRSPRRSRGGGELIERSDRAVRASNPEALGAGHLNELVESSLRCLAHSGAPPWGGRAPTLSGGIALHREAGQSPPPCLLEAQKGEQPYKNAVLYPRARPRASGACDRKARRGEREAHTSHPEHYHLARRSDHTKLRFCLTAQPRRLAAAERSESGAKRRSPQGGAGRSQPAARNVRGGGAERAPTLGA